MMKKLFTLFLAIIATVGNMFAWDYWQVQIGDLYYNLGATNQIAEVTSMPNGKYFGDISIPSSVKYNSTTYTVTSIGEYAFYECSVLTSIEIPNSVTSIGQYAFGNCSSLTSITIPNGVTSIEICAFINCTSLTSVTIPNSVTSISWATFSNCPSLTSVSIGNGVTSINDIAFRNCSSLTRVTIGNNVTSIGESAFEGCSSLSSISFPNSLTSIGNKAFARCRLNYLTIPNSLTTIGSAAYPSFDINRKVTINFTGTIEDWCQKTYNPGLISEEYTLLINEELQQDVIIPENVTSLPHHTFCGCHSLTSVSMPNSITEIGKGVFMYCVGLTSITIPRNVVSIGDYVFKGCSNITSIQWNAQKIENWSSKIFYEYIQSYDTYTFDIRPQITSFIFGDEVEKIPSGICRGMRNLSTITIPESVTFIDHYSFSQCSALTSVTIPKNVYFIGREAFNECSDLSKIVMHPQEPPYDGDNVVDSSVPVFIPCGTLETYLSTSWANYNIQYQPTPFKLKVVAAEPTKGFVDFTEGTICDSLLLSAVPNEGYYFIQWSDGVIENPRTITLTKDTTLKAIFGPFFIKFIDDNDTLLSSQEVEYNTMPIPPVDPIKMNDAQYTYTFSGWIPEIVPAVADATYTATYHAISRSEGIEDVCRDSTESPSKVIENGTIYILMPNGSKYSIEGNQIK